MEWTRSESLALASPKCTRCLGIGMRQTREGEPYACGCVLRTVFRACYGRFRSCVEKEKYLSQVTLGILTAWRRQDHLGTERRGVYRGLLPDSPPDSE